MSVEPCSLAWFLRRSVVPPPRQTDAQNAAMSFPCTASPSLGAKNVGLTAKGHPHRSVRVASMVACELLTGKAEVMARPLCAGGWGRPPVLRGHRSVVRSRRTRIHGRPRSREERNQQEAGGPSYRGPGGRRRAPHRRQAAPGASSERPSIQQEWESSCVPIAPLSALIGLVTACCRGPPRRSDPNGRRHIWSGNRPKCRHRGLWPRDATAAPCPPSSNSHGQNASP
jgi:hypothetical protein